MKPLGKWLLVVCALSVGLPAEASELPNWNIEFAWDSTPFFEGGAYEVDLNDTRDSTYTYPNGAQGSVFGEIYKGTLNSSELVSVHTLSGSGFDPRTDSWLEPGDYFVVIYDDHFDCVPGDICFFPGHEDIQQWFEEGFNFPFGLASPPENWGYIAFSVLEGEVGPESIDPVIIIPGILGSWIKNGVLQIDPILHTFDDLIETLKLNGYTAGLDLFTLPYDWRNDNRSSALLLKQAIDAVKNICLCDKVDLVAHSMGGLVARSYIQSDDYENDVDQLIFIGTPHLGSPKAYLAWEGGEIGVDFSSNFLESVLRAEGKKTQPWFFV